MPFPLLLLIPVAAKTAALLKSGAVVAKGVSVLYHAGVTKTAATHVIRQSITQFGLGTTLAVGVAGTASLGAAATLLESGNLTLNAIADGDTFEALRCGHKFFSDISGFGGLESFGVDLRGVSESLHNLQFGDLPTGEALAALQEHVERVVEATRDMLPVPV